MSRVLPFTEIDTRIGIYGLAVRDGDRGPEVLLTLWNEAPEPLWTMPGGGVEYEEELDAALHREYYEETGLTIDIGEVVSLDQFRVAPPDRLDGSPRPLRGLRIIRRVTITGGTLGVTEIDGSTADVRWWPIDDVPTLPHVGLVDVALATLRQR